MAAASSLLLHVALLLGARTLFAGSVTAGPAETEPEFRVRVSVRRPDTIERARAEPGPESVVLDRTRIPPQAAPELAKLDDAGIEDLLEDSSVLPPLLAPRPSSGGAAHRPRLRWEQGAQRRPRGTAAGPAVASAASSSIALSPGSGAVGTAGPGGADSVESVRPPVQLDAPPPDYPELSRRRGEEGQVLCRIEIAPDGGVTSVSVVASSGSARLDAAARAALLRWRFRPATRGGASIPWSLLHSVAFELR